MSTRPTPPPHGTFKEWLDHYPRIMGSVRWFITVVGLIGLSLIGTFIGSRTPAAVAVAYGPNGCTYQAEEVVTSPYGQTAALGSSFGISWRIRNIGSCKTWGPGVALAVRSNTIPTDQPRVSIQTEAGNGVDVLTVVTPMQTPAQPGLYETAWQMQAPNGQAFGPVMTRRVQVFPAGQLAPNVPLNHDLIDLSQLLRLVVSLALYPLPALLALLTAMSLGASFLQNVYQLKTPPIRHIQAMLFGGSAGHALARGSKITYSGADPAAELIGGPLWVTVADRTAILTERGAKFERILGAGVHRLKSHERVRAVVDLQIQQRKFPGRARALTKDGIPLELEIEVAFRVSEQDISGEAPPPPPPPIGLKARLRLLFGLRVSPTLLEAAKKHRFSREAVRRLVYETAISSLDSPPDWTQTFVVVRAGDITEQISDMRLDDLSSPEDPDIHPLNVIVEKGLTNARQAAAAQGIDVLNMEIGIVEPSAAIKSNIDEQRIGNWMIEWKRRAKILDAEAKAIETQAIEEARAEAQANMIESLIAGFGAATAGDPRLSNDVIALRFIDALETLMQAKSEQREQEKNPEEQPDQSAKTVLIARANRKE